MARLDDLIGQIADKALRQKLQAALADMKRRQRFGLVFEEHIPETSALLKFPIQVGATVQLRSDPEGKRLYKVRALNARGKATLEPEDGGELEHSTTRDLMVVKRFGDPIFPTLTSLGSVRRGPESKPHHAVINGENFHALQLFVYLYEGRVDCIYIDPPYNTGARDWKYNNRYVDSKDAWRHSKWLSFMKKRLILARRLLRPDGVLIVTIDEHEVHHLGMLLEQLFRDYARQMITIVINPKGTAAGNFSRVEEYACFVCPSDREYVAQMPFGFGMPTPPKKDSRRVLVPVEGADNDQDEEAEVTEQKGQYYRKLALRRDGAESSHRTDRPRQFYAVYVDEQRQEVTGIGPELAVDSSFPTGPKGSLLRLYPIDSRGEHRVWRYGRDTMTSLISQGEIKVGRYNSERDTYSLYHLKPIAAAEAEQRKPRTVWWHPSHDAGAHGSSLLNTMLGERAAFPFPKSLYAVRDCLKLIVKDRPEALIVDFFGGSGTALHATCLLNAEDNGSRRCIIVTNNEVDDATAGRLHKTGIFRSDPLFEKHGIFEAVTVPRCTTAITGIRPDGTPLPGDKLYTHLDNRRMVDGFEENIEFFRIDYLDPDEVDLGTQFGAISPSLWLAAGGIGDREEASSDGDMLLPSSSPYAVLFREERFSSFRRALEKRMDISHVWIVTDSEDAFAEMRSALSPRLVTSMLYRDYLRNFIINTRQNL